MRNKISIVFLASAFLSALLAPVDTRQVFAHGVAILECPAIGSGGDLADLRGIRFTVDRSFDAVDVRMDGRDPGTFVFDAELRRSTGFTAPLEAVAVGVSTGPLPGTDTTPFPVVHIDFPATIPVATSVEPFTLKFVNVAGPDGVDLFFEAAGIGNFPCPRMDETDENNVAEPTVRSDPTGFRVLAAPPPTPPVASNVSISGTPQVGQVLTGNYTYADAEGDLEGASTFRWLRDNVAIDGATDRTYTLVAADEGALIRFEVTPVAQSGTSPGLTVRSDNAVGPVAAAPNAPPVASSVSISGIAEVGQMLTGSFTYADLENDPPGASTFRWLRGGTPIAGATAPRYTLVAADQGALVRFEVTPVAQSGTSPGLAVTSDAVGPVTPAPNDPPTASNVLISGTAQVGQVLTGSYTYADAEGDLQGASTFRWLRGGTPIEEATAPTYTLVAADQGATVSFEVTPVAQTGTSPGLAVRSAEAGPVAAALDDPPVASGVRITGTPQVGQVLTGSYAYSDTEADPEGVSTFRWLRGTTPIAGATARTYALVAADQGATVSFKVTPVAQSGTSPGRPIVSAAAGPVAPPINLPPTARNVLIIGTAGVGQVLTGSYTYSDPENDPEGASIFRWLRDGTPIAEATAETYTLVVADQGASVSFEVTPVAQSGTSLGLPVVSASGGPVTSALGRDRDDGPPFVCNGSRCLVPLKCNGVGISCTAQVTLFASVPRASRLSDRPAARAVRRIRFAAGAVNIPPGETRTVRLRLTPRGRRIVNSGTRGILRGVLEIRNSPGGIQTTPIRLRIRVRR